MTDGSLTKTALIEQVARVVGLTKKRAGIIVDTVFGGIVETLHRERRSNCTASAVSDSGAAGRTGDVNPRTGDRVDVPSKRVAYCTPGKELNELLNRDPAQPVAPPLSE